VLLFDKFSLSYQMTIEERASRELRWRKRKKSPSSVKFTALRKKLSLPHGTINFTPISR